MRVMSSSRTAGEVRPDGKQFVQIPGRNSGCGCSPVIMRLCGWSSPPRLALVENARWEETSARIGSHLAIPGWTRILCGERRGTYARNRDSRMRRRHIVSICSAITGFIALSSPAVAQQKTVKACVEEWRADKANMQAKGLSEKAYVAGCRGGAIATPNAAPAAPAPTAVAPAAPSANTAPSPLATPTPGPSAPSAGTPSGELQFATAAQAKSHCSTDTVVWANLARKIYHFYGTPGYGSSKHGAYMCETEAASAGIRPAKNETRPQR